MQTFSSYSFYPYGMLMPGRHGDAGDGYRYGFGGQEADNEVAGEGNSYTAEFWQYDSRLGRRWNIDPVVKEHESPYACFANNPLIYTDPTGADTTTVINIETQVDAISSTQESIASAELRVKEAAAMVNKTDKLIGELEGQNVKAGIIGEWDTHTTQRVKKYEWAMVERYRKKFGLKPRGNKRPGAGDRQPEEHYKKPGGKR